MSEAETKLFRQWLVGYFMSDCGAKEILDIDFDVKKIKDSQSKAEDIVGFLRRLEKQKL